MPWTVEVGGARRNGAVTRYTVRVDGRSFDVGVLDTDVAGLGPEVRAADLVRESFCFLLEREPPEAILASFDLPDIERYFPGYRGAMARRFSR